MTGVVIEFDPASAERLQKQLARLSAACQKPGRLLRALAAAGESQTRRRIESERRGPDGAPWPEWSPNYAKTRHGGHSLLQSTGALLDSLTSFADDLVGGWGTNLRYAAIHQFGGQTGMKPGPAAIPPRPFLGVSAEDLEELADIAEDYLDRLLGAA